MKFLGTSNCQDNVEKGENWPNLCVIMRTCNFNTQARWLTSWFQPESHTLSQTKEKVLNFQSSYNPETV